MDNPYRQKILKAIQKLGQVHSVWDVFSDFVELGALCIANSADKKKRGLGRSGKSNTLTR